MAIISVEFLYCRCIKSSEKGNKLPSLTVLYLFSVGNVKCLANQNRYSHILWKTVITLLSVLSWNLYIKCLFMIKYYDLWRLFNSWDSQTFFFKDKKLPYQLYLTNFICIYISRLYGVHLINHSDTPILLVSAGCLWSLMIVT